MVTKRRAAWGIAKAKAGLSEMIELAADEAQVIERRGKPVAVLVNAAHLEELEQRAAAGSAQRRMQAFLSACAAVRIEGGAKLDVGKREPRKSPFGRR